MQEPSSPPPIPSKKRRLLRWIVLSVGVIALGVFALPFAARQAIGPERLKSLTEQALTDALGRRVTITGDVSIILAPWFGLSVGPVTVADAPGFGDTPMFEARRLEMTIRILPLLARVVSPGSVRVRDLAVHLRRDAAGRSNWDGLAAPASMAASASGWQVAPEPRDIRLENAAVDFHDAATGRSLAVSGVRLATGVGQPFDFSLAFTARGFVPEASLECHVRGKASFDPPSGRLALHDTLVESGLVFPRPVAPGGATPARVLVRGTVDYDSATGKLALSGLDARVAGARLAGSATLDGLPGTPRAKASLTLTAEMAGTWREILGMATGHAPDSLIGVPTKADQPEASPLAMADTVLTAAGNTGAGQAEASLEASADASGLTLSSLRLRLPQGTIAAAGAWTWGDTPAIDAAITVEGVDFARLPLPAGRSTWPWPAPWLSGAELDARLELRHCALAGLAVADAHVTASSRNGRMRLYPVSAVLPGGVVSLDVRLTPVPGAAGLDADVRAALDPSPASPAGARTTARARINGRLDTAGAKGAFQLQTPSPQAAARMLGQSTDLPAASFESRGSFAVAPGGGRLVARANLTDLEAKIAGTVFRGQLGWDGTASDRLTFDLACDGLDLDQLPPLATDDPVSGGFRTEGRLRLDRIAFRGVEAKNVTLSLVSGAGSLSGTLAAAELFGGKLTGKVEEDPSGKLTAALQLAGADVARLPGIPSSSGLTGPVSAKATLEAGGPRGKAGTLAAVIEADSPQLALGRGPDRQVFAGPKAVLTLKGRDTPEATDAIGLDASLAVTANSLAGGHDLRLTATGPLTLDKGWRVKDLGQAKLEGTALWRTSATSKKDVRLALSGPMTIDMAGGFSTGDLHFDAGGLSGKVKIWKKAGEAGPSGFSLETGTLAPRPILSAWGLSLPATLPADRLGKASLSFSGTAGEDGLDIKRLTLAVDDANLTGRGSLPGYDFKRGKWDLTLDRLDWDAYSPHQTTSGPPPLAERRKPFDLKFLREQALDLRLAIGWLKAGNVTFDATTVMANARGGLFTFRQESPRFYGGRFFAEIRGDARESTLKTFVELKLEGFECARFLKDWAEGDTLSSGGATFILAARTSGINEEELRGNLAGNASLQITRGDLKVHEPSAKPGDPPAERIPFDVFSSSWFARNGVAHSDDFRIEGPRMRVAGKGFVDLRDETINLSVTAALAGGSQVPATIIGPLDGPKLTIDRSKILGDAVYKVLQGIVSIPGKAVTRILQIR